MMTQSILMDLVVAEEEPDQYAAGAKEMVGESPDEIKESLVELGKNLQQLHCEMVQTTNA